MKQTGTLLLTKKWGRDSDNSLVLYGVVRVIPANDFPHTETVYISYIGDLLQTGESHKIEIHLENNQGNPDCILEDEIKIKEDLHAFSFEKQVLAAMEFLEPGLYAYVLYIDGEEMSRFQVRVIKVGARAGE